MIRLLQNGKINDNHKGYYSPAPTQGVAAALPSQIWCLSVISLNTEAGWEVQVKSPALEMVAGCRESDWCFVQRNATLGIELV